MLVLTFMCVPLFVGGESSKLLYRRIYRSGVLMSGRRKGKRDSGHSSFYDGKGVIV
jgi:hypothetical protein